MLVLLGAALPVFAAAEFYVEQTNGMVAIPNPARKVVLESLGTEVKRCQPTAKKIDRCSLSGFAVDLGVGGKIKGYLIIPQDAKIWAASAAPVWIVAKVHGKYRILLKQVTYDIKILDSVTRHMRDIKTERSSAAWDEWQLWKYDGQKYAIKKKYSGEPK